MGDLHKNLVDLNLHALPAVTYADITARDADTDFNGAADNIDKIVRVDSPLSFFVLGDTAPTWVEFTSTGLDEFIELIDTPNSYAGAASQLVQVNVAGTALGFTPSPTAATDLLVGASRPITTDAGIELGGTTSSWLLSRLTTVQRDALTPTGGMMLFNTDLSAPDFYSGASWVSMALGGGDVVGPASSVIDNISTFLDTTGKIIKDSGVDVGDISLNTTHRTSDGSDHTFLNQSVTTASMPAFAGGTYTGPLNIENGTNKVKFVFQQSDFGTVVSDKITLVTDTHYVPVGSITLTATLLIPHDANIAIAALYSTLNTSLTFAASSNIGIKAVGNDLGAGIFEIANLTLIGASSSVIQLDIRSISSEGGALGVSNCFFIQGQILNSDNISILFQSQSVSQDVDQGIKLNVTDGSPSFVPGFTFNNFVINKASGVSGFIAFDIQGAWSSSGLNGGAVADILTNETLFDIDSGATFTRFLCSGMSTNVTTGAIFAGGGLDQTTINFMSNDGIPDSVIAGESTITGNTATTVIANVGAYSSVTYDTTWSGSELERLTLDTATGDTTVDATDDARLRADASITLEPASSTKSLSAQFSSHDNAAARGTSFTNGNNFIHEVFTPRENGDTIMWKDSGGTMPAGLAKNTFYYVVEKEASDFRVSYTLGGSAITFTTDGSGNPGYRPISLHGSVSTNSISANSPRDLSPHALITVSTGDEIFVLIRNNDDATNIGVTVGHIRLTD